MLRHILLGFTFCFMSHVYATSTSGATATFVGFMGDQQNALIVIDDVNAGPIALRLLDMSACDVKTLRETDLDFQDERVAFNLTEQDLWQLFINKTGHEAAESLIPAKQTSIATPIKHNDMATATIGSSSVTIRLHNEGQGGRPLLYGDNEAVLGEYFAYMPSVNGGSAIPEISFYVSEINETATDISIHENQKGDWLIVGEVAHGRNLNETDYPFIAVWANNDRCQRQRQALSNRLKND